MMDDERVALTDTGNLLVNSKELLRYEWTSGNVDVDNAFRAGYSCALSDIGEQARPGAPITLTVQFADVADADMFLHTARMAVPFPGGSLDASDQWQRFVAALRATIDAARPVQGG